MNPALSSYSGSRSTQHNDLRASDIFGPFTKLKASVFKTDFPFDVMPTCTLRVQQL